MIRALLSIFAGLILAVALPFAAQAQTCSATVTDIDFGNPDVLSGEWTDALGTLTVTCSRIPVLTVVKICPNLGDGSGGSNGSSRLLRSSTGVTLAYQLYQDASRTQGWGAVHRPQLGNVPAILLGGGLFSGTATSTVTIYARLFGGQSTASSGSYQSVFAGADAAFTYAPFFLGTSASCTGFVGTATIHPEFDVTARIGSNCSLSTADLDFGSVGVITSAISGQSNLQVTCIRGTSYAITLDGGQANAAPTARQMRATTGDSVVYGLYRDAARTQPWGNTAANRIGGTGTGSRQTYQVYGQVPVQSTPRPGVYSDRIVVTVSY